MSGSCITLMLTADYYLSNKGKQAARYMKCHVLEGLTLLTCAIDGAPITFMHTLQLICLRLNCLIQLRHFICQLLY